MQNDFSRVTADSFPLKLQRSQDVIYDFLLELVKTKPPEEVLQEFRTLFFEYSANPENAEAMQELSAILTANEVQDFIYTLKRCCYILINNWETKRNRNCIQQLVEGFNQFDTFYSSSSRLTYRLKNWLNIFRTSRDYQDLLLYTNKTLGTDAAANKETQHWSERYVSYLLVPQYANTNNSKEQRELALTLSKKLKDKFKFDLAMYTTRSQLTIYRNKHLENPTNLGEDVLRLIKRIIAKKGEFSYINLAHIFLKQVQGFRYQDFKESLLNYLFFLTDRQKGIEGVKNRLSRKVKDLYLEYEDEYVDNAIFLRTCKKIIDFLSTQTGEEPSKLLVYLWFQSNPLTLVILLLKIILICPNARTHLETRIAELIEYYQKMPEENCQWAIDFFEIFQIAFAIYADNDVQYNLIKIKEHQNENADTSEEAILDSYCIFSQCRGYFSEAWSESHQAISNGE
jgi:hypothetical protein